MPLFLLDSTYGTYLVPVGKHQFGTSPLLISLLLARSTFSRGGHFTTLRTSLVTAGNGKEVEMNKMSYKESRVDRDEDLGEIPKVC